MKWSAISALAIALGISVAGLSGCSTMQIAMNPKVPGDISCRLPYRVGLYLAPEFEGYHWPGTLKGEGRGLDYDLGSASTALFLQTFMHVAREVQLVNRKPPYSGPDEPSVSIVIEPQLVGFGEYQSGVWITAFGAHIDYRAIVYDRTGAVLLDKMYRGDGEAQGARTYSPAGNFAAPAEIAMSRAIAALLSDVCQLSVTP